MANPFRTFVLAFVRRRRRVSRAQIQPESNDDVMFSYESDDLYGLRFYVSSAESTWTYISRVQHTRSAYTNEQRNSRIPKTCDPVISSKPFTYPLFQLYALINGKTAASLTSLSTERINIHDTPRPRSSTLKKVRQPKSCDTHTQLQHQHHPSPKKYSTSLNLSYNTISCRAYIRSSHAPFVALASSNSSLPLCLLPLLYCESNLISNQPMGGRSMLCRHLPFRQFRYCTPRASTPSQ